MSPDDPRHGTVAGYNAHRKYGPEPCDDCRRAMATYGAGLALDHMRGRVRKLDATGTARRVQALVALGYTFGRISAELGVAHDVARHLAMHRKTVRTATAERVSEVYERLCMRPAPDSKGAKYARTTARRHGWYPPMAWLDIDDPNEIPDLGEVKYDTRGRPNRRDALIEDAEWLADDDLHLDVVVERLGVTRDNFHAACRRAGRLDLYHRLARRLPYGAGADSMAQHARRTA